MKWTGSVVGALSLAAVLAFVLHESERPAPGPLHPSHASVEALTSCESCHSDDGDWVDACGRCHTAVTAQIVDQRGLHGLLEEADRCAQCHVEHHGAQVALVGPASFSAAGIPARVDFDHDVHAGVPTGLHGKHDELGCVACHANADDPHEETFGSRCEGCHGQQGPFASAAGFDHSRFPLVDSHSDFGCATCHTDAHPIASDGVLRDVRACADCHDDPHRTGPLVLNSSADCARCHDATSFTDAGFDAAGHAAVDVPMRGRHADAPCAGCHAPTCVTDDLRQCVACHDDVHAAAALPPPLANADRAGPLWKASPECADCHDEAGFRPALIRGAEHGRFGPALAGAHLEIACIACHSSSEAPAATDACAACHDSPHRAEFLVGATCVRCHVAADATFASAGKTLSLERHTDLLLRAPHDQECNACHPSSAPFVDRFPGRVAEDCAACHGDPHEGAFASRAFADAACQTCHTPERFSPSSFTPALHARTEFPLTGAHTAIACAACHPAQGAQRRFDGAPTACAECHDDPHGGAFDRARLPTEVDGRRGCARCHSTEGFRSSVGASFDHEFWTGQHLSGAHARAGCGRCHDRSTDGALGDAPSACAACHADPHRGQFRRTDGTDCARCHEERESFSEVRFDHDHDTRFRLDPDHARLTCASCHRPVSLTGGQTVILYRPLGTSCRDCHAPGTGADRRVPR